MDKLIARAISEFEEDGAPVKVSLSNELVHLLSDQLYQSPSKAMEELVVNAYDAESTECRIYVPSPSSMENRFIIVFDDGIGMDKNGLVNLWQIGRSNKRTEEVERRHSRKQIGKFGIGKLATYTIANRLTHITKSDGKILSVTVDFKRFHGSPSGTTEPIEAPVWVITDWDRFLESSGLADALELADVDTELMETDSWTIALLEDLKDKAREMTERRLRWILSTAMPLQNDFQLYLNREEITSSKEDYERTVEFSIHKLPEKRLKGLLESTGETWKVEGNSLVSESFESGVTGSIIVTKRTLLGKSDDIERSHGFFIKVRNRLVNEGEPLFGLTAVIHGTFNRFRADIHADDLDDGLKASRETIEESKAKVAFRALLREVFNEANQRYTIWLKKQEEPNASKREGEKSVVAPRLVEHPIADALIIQKYDESGAEADESWFYLQLEPETNLDELVQKLYTDPRGKYKFRYSQKGSTARLVKFDLKESTFWLNTDHDLVKEYKDEGRARDLLEDFAVAETLLEIYLRTNQIPSHLVGEILSKRDILLRSLVKDHISSPGNISRALRDAAADEHELEVALVVAARAIGFVAKHISGSGEPDGIARFTDFPDGEKIITLEAKSSKRIPTLAQLDFAGLEDHVRDNQAHGCLLVAPSYPGTGGDCAVANRAKKAKISCWTIEQLADFIDVSESRHLNATHLINIVLECFSPEKVTEAWRKLLAEPKWSNRELYKAILGALQQLDGRIKDKLRNIDMISTEVSRQEEFSKIEGSDIEKAVRELANSSQGGMTLTDGGSILIHVSLGELERRLSGLTKDSGEPRKLSNFRKTQENPEN